MQIQINTDHNINGNEALIVHFSGVIIETLSRFSNNITRVEVHLSDENSDKKEKEKDKRCLIEARLEGSLPLAVTHMAPSLDKAVAGAADKLIRLIENNRGKKLNKKNS